MAEAAPSTRIPQIDAVRGFAAIYVIVYHFVVTHRNAPGTSEFVRSMLTNRIFNGGTWVVQLFFCASGFLVFGSMQRKTLTDPKPIRSFYLRRAFRILPLWWAVLLLHFFAGRFDFRVLTANMFFIFGFLPFPKFLPIPVSWSLFAEELFYLFLPLAFRRLLNPAVLWTGALLAFAVSMLWLKYGMLWSADEARFLAFSPLAHMQFFFIGMGLQLLFVKGKIAGVPRTAALNIALILSLTAAFFDVGIPSEITVPLVFVSGLRHGSLFNAIFDNRFFRWAGVRCYGIYLLSTPTLFQWPLGVVVYLTGAFHRSFEYQAVTLLPGMILWTLVLAQISFILIERPALRFAKR